MDGKTLLASLNLTNQLTERDGLVLDVAVLATLALTLISGFDHLGRTISWLLAAEHRAVAAGGDER